MINRIRLIIENEGVSVRAFEQEISASNGLIRKAIANGTDIQSKWVSAIVDKFPQYSPDWLLTGYGPMLRSDLPEAAPTAPGKGIPLISLKVAAGFGSADFNISAQDVKDFYVIPKFKHRKIDFMIEITGSSMYPKYNSGDVIACTIIKESSFIQWNKCHVIATVEQGLLVKRIREGRDTRHILAISDNKEYPPFEIPKTEITGIALVMGVIRLE